MTIASASDLHLHAPALEPAFEALYEEHFDYVWTNLRRLGVHGSDLDDAVQETFIVVYRRLGDFEHGASWRGWLFGIARRIASRHRRGLGRRLRGLAALSATPAPIGDGEDELTRIEAARLLQKFLDRIEPRKREVFILAELEGFSGSEISEALGVPANTVGSRLRAARGAFERWVEMLRARERGAAARLDRTSLVQRTREARPPQRARERVRQAVAARVAMPVGITPWWAAVKPVAIAAGLGAAGITAAVGVLPRDPAPIADDGSIGRAEHRRAEASRFDPGTRAPTREAADPASASVEAVKAPVATAIAEPPPERDMPAASTSESIVATPSSRRTEADRSRDDRAVDDAPVDPSTLAAEADLVARIRTAAQGSDPASALALADEHARTYPYGVLERERRALVIAALCRLGRDAQAAAQARAWSRAHPDAPLPTDVRDGCTAAEKKVDEATP